MSKTRAVIRREVRVLSSRYENGVPMYPGNYLFTWLRVGLVWHLVGMERME